LRVLAEGGSMTLAAQGAGFSRDALYCWKNDDEAFAAECLDAIEQGTDRLEDEAIRRAVQGGSDTMLIFMLKGRRRDKWGDKQTITHSGEILTKEARDASVSAALTADR